MNGTAFPRGGEEVSLKNNPTNRSTRDAAAVAAAFLVQVFLLLLQSPTYAVAAVFIALGGALRLGGYGLPGLLRSLRPMSLLLLAVLSVRLVTDFSRPTVFDWLSYASRILAAVIVALTLVRRIGPSGVRRGLMLLLTPLPVSVRRPVVDLVSSVLYVMPVVFDHFSAARGAARVRLSRSRAGPVRRTVMTARAGLVSLGPLPPRRAEAMVVRGILESDRR